MERKIERRKGGLMRGVLEMKLAALAVIRFCVVLELFL